MISPTTPTAVDPAPATLQEAARDTVHHVGNALTVLLGALGDADEVETLGGDYRPVSGLGNAVALPLTKGELRDALERIQAAVKALQGAVDRQGHDGGFAKNPGECGASLGFSQDTCGRPAGHSGLHGAGGAFWDDKGAGFATAIAKGR